MGKNLYARLAMTNIKKNKDINLPYIVAFTIITALYFIVVAMIHNKGLKNVPASNSVLQCFQISNGIIRVISFVFMIYINSFLIKKRLKEFGLYNILGLEKKHIIYVMLIENVIVFGASILGGMILGTVFGKFSFLVLLKFCHTSADSKLLLSLKPYMQTLELFGVIFLFCCAINMFTIWRNKTIDLLHRDKYGEKKVKGLLFFTIIGIVFLGIAYYMANTTSNYIEALQIFFPAVIMVIIATYLLFMTGSIVLLNILKNNKKFYYKSRNFISTSSLIYRMKQNAVGLANICILSTMVIVTAAGCTSLYLGQEKITKHRNPYDLTIEKQADIFTEDIIRQTANKNNVAIEDYFEFNGISGGFLIQGNSIVKLDSNLKLDIQDYLDSLYDFIALSADEYNKISNTNLHLEANHIALVSIDDLSMLQKEINMEGKMYQVDDIITDSALLQYKNGKKDQTIYIICSNAEEAASLTNLIYQNEYETNEIQSFQYINYKGEKNDRLSFAHAIMDLSREKSLVTDIDTDRIDAYGMFGGLLFIGIFFIIIFLTITILIIYFKQITEGFDDRERFGILQKVGMDEKMVKQTINRQIIIVFFMPLIMALIHLVAASNIIKSMLTAFYLPDMLLILQCIIATSFAFAIVYIIVYKLTAKTYYKIVKF